MRKVEGRHIAYDLGQYGERQAKEKRLETLKHCSDPLSYDDEQDSVKWNVASTNRMRTNSRLQEHISSQQF
jgi:hypothetical protein